MVRDSIIRKDKISTYVSGQQENVRQENKNGDEGRILFSCPTFSCGPIRISRDHLDCAAERKKGPSVHFSSSA